LFIRQYGMVSAGKNLVVIFRQRNFNQGLAFVTAEYNAYGFIFFGEFHKAVIVIDVHRQSDEILVSQLAIFKSEKKKKNHYKQCNKRLKYKSTEMFFIKADTHLSTHKGKALPSSNRKCSNLSSTPAKITSDNEDFR